MAWHGMVWHAMGCLVIAVLTGTAHTPPSQYRRVLWGVLPQRLCGCEGTIVSVVGGRVAGGVDAKVVVGCWPIVPAVPCRAVPCRAVPCRAVLCRVVLQRNAAQTVLLTSQYHGRSMPTPFRYAW